MAFPYINVWGCKYHLAVNRSKVKLQPSFEEILKNPLCHMSRFSLKGFLVLEKKNCKRFYQIWTTRRFYSTVQNHSNKLSIPFDRKPQVKSGENCSSGFREDIKKIHNFIHVYSQGSKADNPQGTKCWLYLKGFNNWIIHCKLQSSVFDTFWEKILFNVIPMQI